MDLGSIFIIFALVLLTILYVSRPFYEKIRSIPAPEVTSGESNLLAEKEYLLNVLRELEDNFAEQKISKEDYLVQRHLYIEKGIEVLQQLENYEITRMARIIQEEIFSINLVDGDIINDPLEAKIGERRRIRKERGAGFCPKCGSPLQKSDRFCWKCGNKTSLDKSE